MKMHLFVSHRSAPLLIVFLVCFGVSLACAANPDVSNVRASQNTQVPGSTLVDIWYDVSDADGDLLEISLVVTSNGTDIGAASFSGHMGSGKAANHPVQTVTWYECVKWCNARSEKEGRNPAYYTSSSKTTVYKSGNLDIEDNCVDWNNGYRLPTKTEWEYAARGGVSSMRFPWGGNTIQHAQANYYEETVTNQEIYASVYNGSSWGELMRLTTNNVQDTRPQAVYDAAGGLLVTWYRDGHLMADNDLVLGDATAVGAVGESSSAKAFDLVTGPEGQVSLVWEDYASDGTGPDPFMLNYDATLQSWSQPLQLLSDDILERSLSSAYTSTGSLLVVYAQHEFIPGHHRHNV